ncbi:MULTISPECIES: restriction endonuclease subunit S [unclassified Streptomyces]|uniref:restriction endonuclease subunit S n=1 Tax=unclassified Streptomyces TaxID=2593676 RepID=UPI0033B9F113
MEVRRQWTFRELAAAGHLEYGDGYRTKRAEIGSTGYPILRVAEVLDGRIAPAFTEFVRPEFRAVMRGKVSRPGDVVLTTKGTVGRVALMPVGVQEFVYSPQVCYFRTPVDPLVEPGFIYYWFRSEDFRRQAAGMKSQTDMADYLNLADIGSLRISPPVCVEQKAIVEVLGALDDKIALNEQLAGTALDLAGSLYEHESTGTGGWVEVALSETARWLSGGTPKTTEPSYWGGDIPWISAASLKTPWLYDSERRVTSVGARNGTRLVPKGTVLFVVRGMSLTSEFRVGIAQREVAFGQDCKALIPHPDIDPATLFLAIKAQTANILGMVDLAGHGTGRLVTERIANLRVRLPQGRSATEFAARVGALLDRVVAATHENRTLADLRDTLLPQLLSGKLRVRDAVRTVEEAV